VISIKRNTTRTRTVTDWRHW